MRKATTLAAVVALMVLSPDAAARQDPRPQPEAHEEYSIPEGRTIWRYQEVAVQNSGWLGFPRQTLEIEAPEALIYGDRVLTMMVAALAQYDREKPRAIAVRLWEDCSDPLAIAINGIKYAPDGCGWTGDECTGEIWTDLLRGEILAALTDFGR